MTSALDGIRVIDFGQYIAGPLAAMLLADQGADVIRVDPPGGPRYRSPANAIWNRGKRSVVLDLKQADDSATARRLVRGADVLIENFRPGVMERLGLGERAMTEANPGLIYCSLPGFAADDPRAELPAWEGVIGAATRTYPLRAETGTPVYTAIPISSCYAAFQGVVSIAMALNARTRDGLGQRIEMPLFDATFAAIGARGLRIHNRPPAPIRGAVATWTRQFECKDGRWIQFHAGNSRFGAFAEAVGATEWEEGEEKEEAIRELFKGRTALEWEDLAEQLGTECAVCRTSAEWLQHPQARASQIVVETADPSLGTLVQPGINVRLSGTPGVIRTASPALDSGRAAILRELDSQQPAMGNDARVSPVRAALEGVRVVDLCIVLAGPTCGRTLAEFGADVIKIDSPARQAVAFHNDINRGKRSILLDLKSAEGLEVFWRLVADADVVVQNFRRGVAERIGIGYEQVRRRRPDIVYASLNTYGQLGPWAGRPGHEQIAQAASGMQERFGGGERPVLQNFAVNDYGTGFMGAFGVALALWHRRRTGEGQHVDTALAYTATILQSPYLQLYEGKSWKEPRGQDALGSSPLHRAYKASDGWIFLGARPSDLPRLADALQTPAMTALSSSELEYALEAVFAQSGAREWEERLRNAGIGAQRVVEDIAELMADPWVRAHGLSITREHEGFGLIDTTGPGPRLSRTPPVPGRPAPKPGSDAPSILGEIGLGTEVSRLAKQGVIMLDGMAVR